MTTKDVNFGSAKIKLKRFDLKNMAQHSTIAMIAKRASGKSYLTREIMYHKRNMPSCLVISKTEKLINFMEILFQIVIFLMHLIPLFLQNFLEDKVN